MEATPPAETRATDSLPVDSARLLSRSVDPVERVAVLIALVLAAALRLYNLGAESLWNDELATVSITRFGPFAPQTWNAIAHDVHPPGYYFLIAAWQLVFGDSEGSLRLPSALAGIAFCWALYAFARRYLSPAIAIVAIYISAVSPFLIKYSQEARAYSLVCLLVTWVADTWLRLCVPEQTQSAAEVRRRSAIAGGAFAAASYAHYSGLIAASLIVGLIGAYSLATRRSVLPRLRNALLFALALYAPWAPWLVGHLAKGGLSFLRPPQLADALGYPGNILPTEVWIALAGMAAFSALALHRARARGTRLPPAATTLPRTLIVSFLVCWAVLTIVLVYVKSRISTPIFNERNLIVVAPPILLLAAVGVCAGAESVTRRILIPLALVCALSLHILITNDQYYSGEHKEHFRQATQLALGQVQSLSDVKVVALCHARHFDYYLHRLGSPLTLIAAVPRSSRVVAAVDDAWATGAGHVLLLWGHLPLGSSARKLLASKYHVLSERHLRGAGYVLMSRE